jgi:hypothetical protein
VQQVAANASQQVIVFKRGLVPYAAA